MAHTATGDKKRPSRQRHLRHGSRHRAFPWLLLLLLGLTGCVSYRVDRATQLNAALCYLPLDDCGTPVQGVACPAPVNKVHIQPGMKLTIHNTPLRPSPENLQPPPLVSYDWIVPAPGSYSQEDLFFLMYALETGVPDPRFSEAQPLNSAKYLQDFVAARKPDVNDFYDSLTKLLLDSSIPSLTLTTFRSGPAQYGKCTAHGVREFLTKPGKENFENPQTAQQSLTLSIPGLDPSSGQTYADVTLFGWNSGFFYEPVALALGLRKNAWYRQGANILTARAHLGLEIPVRVEPDWTSRYFPIYWSIRDLEKRLGIHVAGVRRRKEHFAALDGKSHRWCVDQGTMREKCFLAKDDYFTLCFDGLRHGFGARGYLYAHEYLKDELLLAPGDVIIANLRRQASDRPEIR
jgi:hypothetical protein